MRFVSGYSIHQLKRNHQLAQKQMAKYNDELKTMRKSPFHPKKQKSQNHIKIKVKLNENMFKTYCNIKIILKGKVLLPVLFFASIENTNVHGTLMWYYANTLSIITQFMPISTFFIYMNIPFTY